MYAARWISDGIRTVDSTIPKDRLAYILHVHGHLCTLGRLLVAPIVRLVEVRLVSNEIRQGLSDVTLNVRNPGMAHQTIETLC